MLASLREVNGSIRKKITSRKSAMIGLAQGISAFPGISRSGLTISAGIFLGVDAIKSARFSFLISVPAILFANIYSLIREGFAPQMEWIYYIIGAVISGLVGFGAISLLMMIIKKRRFGLFGLYCFLVSIISLIMLNMGVQLV